MTFKCIKKFVLHQFETTTDIPSCCIPVMGSCVVRLSNGFGNNLDNQLFIARYTVYIGRLLFRHSCSLVTPLG